MKKIKHILIVLIIIYLFVSSIYILSHIDFYNPPETVGMGFSSSNNLIRIFMGLSATVSTYQGVSPWFLIEVIIKIIIAIVLIIYEKKSFDRKRS